MAVTIHPTALVDPSAKIGDGTVIGPYCIVGAKVQLGSNNTLRSHVVIEGNTLIGESNLFYQFSSIGSAPQDLKYKGEDSRLEIGNNNTFREYATAQPGTAGGGMLTKIGHRNLFMASTHVGHDTIVGDNNVLANSVGLSGHVTVGNGVILGGLSAVHQFVRIGDIALLAGGAMVTQDIPPYTIVQGDRAEAVGINSVGLKRNGFPEEEIQEISRVFKAVYFGEGLFSKRIEGLLAEKLSARARQFIEFMQNSERGVVRYQGR